MRELKARTPRYFNLLIRGKISGAAKSVTNEHNSHTVYCKFGAVAPKTSATAWLEFLRHVDTGPTRPDLAHFCHLI